MYFIFTCFVGLFFIPSPANALERIWVNYKNLGELETAPNAVTSARVPGTNLSQIIVDDFVIKQPTRIEKIVFFARKIGQPVFLGADVYIWDAFIPSPGNPPYGGPLFLAEALAPATIQPVTIHSSGSLIMRVMVSPTQQPVLQPGRYFIGYRVVMAGNGDKFSVVLTNQFPIKATDCTFFNFYVDDYGNNSGSPWKTLSPWPNFLPQHTFNFGPAIEGAVAIGGTKL